MEVIAAPRFPAHPSYKKSKEAPSDESLLSKAASMVGSFVFGGGGNKKNPIANSHKVNIFRYFNFNKI